MANRLGVALFHDADAFSRTSNVACEYGGKPFEFATAADLPSDVLWVTNLDYDTLREAGLSKTPRIANDGYFRTRLPHMIHELGLRKATADAQAAVLSGYLGIAGAMLKNQLRITQYPAYGMPQAVGQLYGSPDLPMRSNTYMVAEQAGQRYTACQRQGHLPTAEHFTFWYPRAQWAEQMLSIPTPSGQLQVMPRHTLPSLGNDPRALVAYAYESKLPIFARIKVNGLKEGVGQLMNYGAGAMDIRGQTRDGNQYDARNFREWCALPELDFLVSYGDVEVLEVVCAQGWNGTGIHTHKTKLSQVSYAYGLAAENLWAGKLRKNTGNFGIAKNLSSSWLQAEDRMRCLIASERLHSLGFEITNYGNGRISVACPKSIRALIPQAAYENNLLYPGSLEGLVISPRPVPTSLSVQQMLLLEPDHQRKWHKIDEPCAREIEVAYAT